ncbi:phytoene desaturase family protein [Williamsia soli]|uniref:phytoene desaturase family protein n=1 Tax=Williamsia soli TaxID=364929 RepID=UPI001A9FCFC0|nr:phytoene desaturase family protein [Williamsia soli]
MSQIVVIGAGVGGLAAAARLAAQGHSVTLIEQAPSVGGKLGVEHVDGFVFDTGPSLLTLPQVLDDLFAAIGGATTADELPLRRLEIACRYTFPDGVVLDLPGEVTEIPSALDAALGPGRGAQWSAFSERAERIWNATVTPFLESPIDVRTMLRLSRRLRDLMTIAPWKSLRGLGTSYLADPRLRMLLDRYATYTGSDPRQAPAALASVPYAEQAFGSWYVDGGLGRIAAVLLSRAQTLGVEVRLGTQVTEILTDATGVRGVRLSDGSVTDAEFVVANADAQQVFNDLLSPDQPGARAAARRLRRTTRSLSGFVLLLALDDPPNDQPHHHVLFAEDYDEEFDAVFGRNGRPRPVPRPTIYVSAPADHALTPDARTGAWFVLVNAPPHDPAGGTDWDKPGLREEYADQILDLMAARGLDVSARIRHRVIISPADLERRTLTPGGSIYGTSSNGALAAFLRPSNRSPVPGLYLVGGSSHPGGGLPLVMMSAAIVANMIGVAD